MLSLTAHWLGGPVSVSIENIDNGRGRKTPHIVVGGLGVFPAPRGYKLEKLWLPELGPDGQPSQIGRLGIELVRYESGKRYSRTFYVLPDDMQVVVLTTTSVRGRSASRKRQIF